MRIIAGKYKNTPLKTLEGKQITRPTRGIVREALFSSIVIYSDTLFLDLFSGSGAIGIEALSRGAQDVIFNDMNPEAVKIIKANLDKVKENRTVYNLDYRNCLKKKENTQFDYIYCDPPYDFKGYEDIFFDIHRYNNLSDEGIIILEVSKDRNLDDKYLVYHKYKEKHYGANKLLYYRRDSL
ncbi:MAG: 16S rRNA (guanine(966)-N(2))-methyltransferase RsmD [Erysipelotrichaceae bacterium]|nr:16S rRNA (guanine(966)-N(2))-methyltransferase RsmD [Erysipelotrichaceae bacterium]